MTEEKHCDIAIIGGACAGLAAGLYAARARRKTILLEKGVVGGQISLTDVVENYPGIDTINGFDLGQAMLKQAEANGLETEYVDVTGIERDGRLWRVGTSNGDILSKAAIIATGADYNKLGIPGEERLTGRGVSYCATCDAAFFKDQEVAVIGGGDAAMDEGLFTSRYASKVYVIHRRSELRASRVLQERAFANSKMRFIWNTVTEEVVGEADVSGVRIRNLETDESRVLPVKAVFVFIGHHPNTAYLPDGLLEMDKAGHIIVNEWMETSCEGLYAAGDVRQNSARQAVTAAGDGATAAIAADHYISNMFPAETAGP